MNKIALAWPEIGVWKRNSHPPEAIGHLSAGVFYYFSIKITHLYAYFGWNNYFKSI